MDPQNTDSCDSKLSAADFENILLNLYHDNKVEEFFRTLEHAKHLVPKFSTKMLDCVCFFGKIQVERDGKMEGSQFDTFGVMRTLLKMGSPIHKTALVDALFYHGNVEMAQMVWEAGAPWDRNDAFRVLNPKTLKWLIDTGLYCVSDLNNEGRSLLETLQRKLNDPTFTYFLTEEGCEWLKESVNYLEEVSKLGCKL